MNSNNKLTQSAAIVMAHAAPSSLECADRVSEASVLRHIMNPCTQIPPLACPTAAASFQALSLTSTASGLNSQFPASTQSPALLQPFGVSLSPILPDAAEYPTPAEAARRGQSHRSGSVHQAGPKRKVQKRQPNEPRRQSTRGAKAETLFEAARRDDEARAQGEADAAEDMKEEVMSDAKKKEPADLNYQATTCDPVVQHDRIFFTPSCSMPRWPLYLTLLAPYFTVVYLSTVSPRLAFVSLFAICVLQLVFLYAARRLSNSRSYLAWLRHAAVPTDVDPSNRDSVAEALHTRPESDMDSYFTCLFIWYLQCLAAQCSGAKAVISGVAYHMGRFTEAVTKRDVRLPNQQGIVPAPNQVMYDSWAVASFSTGFSTMLLSCETVARQFIPRLRSLTPADRVLQAESMSSRVSNVIISGSIAPEVFRGSAEMARTHCASADISSAVVQDAYSYSAVAVDFVASALMIMASVAAIGDAATTGSMVVHVPSALFLVCVVPTLEELIKTGLGRAVGSGRLWSCQFFGALELSLGLVGGLPLPLLLPAFIMHAASGFLSTAMGIILHAVFNGLVICWNVYRSIPAPRAPSGLDAAPAGNSFDDRIRQLCTYWNSPYRQDYPAGYFDNGWFVGDIHCGFSVVAAGACVVVAAVLIKRPPVNNAVRLAACTLYAVGYRVTEVCLPPVKLHGAKVKKLPAFFAPVARSSAACSLGFVLRNVVPPFPDFCHPATVLNGVLKRFCKTPPTPNARKLRRLRRFVQRYVRTHYTPIAPDADTSVPTWLAGTDYPEWRKTQLLKCWEDRPWVEAKDLANEGFAKKEFYTAFKAARGINSRSDTFKCATGPYFKLMESQVYDQPCFDGVALIPGETRPFIKHIPVHLRPEFIERMLGSHPGPYYETDYSEFEKHFTPAVMESLELVLYDHMLHHHPEVASLIRDALAGTNKCVYRGFIIKILGKRMSGDMCTSLGNGISNLMLFQFAAHLKGGVAVGVVEGDDALFVSSVPLCIEDFEQLGFEIKIDCFTSLYSSSFCGMLSSQDGIVLRNIARVIPKFGWSLSPRRVGGPAVKMALLRARALSLAYESPRCPIICALAKRALEVTYGFAPLFDASYHHKCVQGWIDLFSDEMLLELEKGPSLQARVDFADKFGISVRCQLRAEQIFSTWDGTPLSDPFIDSLFLSSVDMEDFSWRFVADSERHAVDRADCHSQ